MSHIDTNQTGIDALRMKINTFCHAVAMETANEARMDCPVKTGRLAGSVRVEHIADGHDRVSANTEYAIFVELGTYKMAAQPFLRPGLDAALAKFS